MIELLTALALQTVSQPCLQPGDRIRGELRYVEAQHPNGQVMRSPFVALSEPRCVDDAAMGRADGKWVQIAGNAAQAASKLPLGSTVIIEAQDWMAPHTVWHFGDFVANQTTLVGYELP